MAKKVIAFSNRNCCVPQCHSRASRDEVSFHYFPKEEETVLQDGKKINRRELWASILRIGKPVTKHMVVCSKHFEREDYILPSVSTIKPRLKKIAVPSKNIPLRSTEDPLKIEAKRKESEIRKERHSEINRKRSLPSTSSLNEDIPTLHLQADCQEANDEVVTTAGATLELAKHLPSSLVANKLLQPTSDVGVQVATSDFISPRLNISSLTAAELKTLTGIPTVELLEVFIDFFKKNVPSVSKRKFLSVKEQIIMSFMRLYLNIKFVVLSIFFKVSGTTCKTIFLDVIHNLSQLLAPCIPWSSKEEIQCNMPKCFKYNQNVRVVIDCTEVPTEKSKCLTCKINMYSHYKGKQTIKFLVGVSPAGLFTFLSKGYGGRASDKAIFKQSGIVEMVDPYHDSIMADKGFLVEEECIENGVDLVRPAFLKKGKLNEAEARSSRNIATSRVHVERAIQRLKVFNFLQDKIPLELIPEMDDILTIIVALSNLGSPILSEEKF